MMQPLQKPLLSSSSKKLLIQRVTCQDENRFSEGENMLEESNKEPNDDKNVDDTDDPGRT